MIDIEYCLNIKNVIIGVGLGKGSKKEEEKMVGFIQHSSDPSQPGRALDKKKIKNSTIFCMSLLSPNLVKTLKKQLISASFKMFFLGKVEVKKSD